MLILSSFKFLFSFRSLELFFQDLSGFAIGLGVGNRKGPSKMKDWLVFQDFLTISWNC